MTVKEFVEGYKKAKDKIDFVNKHITTNYVPYIEKVTHCKSIAKATTHKMVGENEYFVIDSPTRHLLYTIKLIELYTDIEIDLQNIANDYDELNKNKILGVILNAISEDEQTEFKFILESVMNDIYENERSVGAILGISKEAIGMTIGSIFDGIQDAFEKNEVPENENIEIKLTTDNE